VWLTVRRRAAQNPAPTRAAGEEEDW
jgi:hypothetical protein